MHNDYFRKIYDPLRFQESGERVVNDLGDYLHGATFGKDGKTITYNHPENELEFWANFLKTGRKEDFLKEIIGRTNHIHHPKYVGHQVSPPVPDAALAALIGTLLNNGMAVYEMGMAPSAMERVVTDILCKKLGYDNNAGGFLTSGGTLANLTALLAARKTKVARNVWNLGMDKPLGIMVSEEAHYCIDRAVRIMGMGAEGVIKIPANERFGMNTNVLEEYYEKAVSKGIQVFAIVGSAPSTATGAHDDLEQIGHFARSKNLWFHADCAHGGPAIFSKAYRHLLKGIDEADSVVIDGHKMMLMPTLTTALLFKHKHHAQQTFNQRADYLLNDSEEDQWFQSGQKTFECTKTMMPLYWYVLLMNYGDELFDRYVTRQYDLAKNLAKMIASDPDFELAVTPESNILCFRWVNNSNSVRELNGINQSIRKTLLNDGEFYIVQTRLRNIQYLRTTLMNPFTEATHLQQLLKKIKTIAKTLS